MTLGSRIKRFLGLPWSPRTMIIVIPLHVVAFAGLYAGVFHLVMKEVAMVEVANTKSLLNTVVNELHTAMVCKSTPDIRRRLDGFVAAHHLAGLSIYDPEGRSIGPAGPHSADVLRFLSSGKEETSRMVASPTTVTVWATSLIKAGPQCSSCHSAGTTLGVAVVNLDLTSQLEGVRHRIALQIALLAAVWVFLVGILSVGSRRIAERSIRILRADVEAGGSRPPGSSPKAPAVLDPTGAKLYRTLRRTLEEARDHRERMADRFEHAERLASLGKLSAGLAHEIKNPLAGIQGALELLIDESDREERVDLYERMLEEVKRVNRTLQSLLHFARPAQPKRTVVSIPDLLKDIVDLAAPGLHRKNITIDIAATDTLPGIAIDPEQIRQVLVNLVTNAADAIGKDGSITLSASPFPDGAGLILAVTDNGPGIAEEDLERLFEPFFTTKLHGTGLGLAVAKRIVDQHGGAIEVTSLRGRETTFFVLLPEPTGEHPAVGTQKD